MSHGLRVGLVAVLGAGLLTPSLAAQGYRLRLDARAQAAAYRGVRADSVLFTDVVVGPTGGFQTSDGFFVHCDGGTRCFFFRPGPYLQGGPVVTSADLTLWGLGLNGLSLRVNARAGADLGETDAWPGTDPPIQLLEAYADYASRSVTGRLGRQLLVSRLGTIGFDGGRALVRAEQIGLEADGYVGYGLARATALPVSSSAINPLDDFQPRSRQLVAGGALGWAGRYGQARLEYQREVDRDSRQFGSERLALSGELRPFSRLNVTGGAEYDLANTWFGNADLSLRYTTSVVTALVGARQYRPHFDLWTIWGAFSPVPYHAVNASLWVHPIARLELRGRWEGYAYSPTETSTPLVDVDDDGWRLGVGASYSPNSVWTLDAGYREEYGPGASSHGFEASVSAGPLAQLTLTAYGSTLDRPLEFRFEETGVDVLGLDAEWRSSERLRLALGGAHYREDRRRPDVSGIDWNQTRLHAGVTLFLGSGADHSRLPRALRTRAPAGTR